MGGKRRGRTQAKERGMRENEDKDAMELSSMLGEELNGVTPPTPPPPPVVGVVVEGGVLGLLMTVVEDGAGMVPPAALQIPTKRNSSNQTSKKIGIEKTKKKKIHERNG